MSALKLLTAAVIAAAGTFGARQWDEAGFNNCAVAGTAARASTAV